MSHEDPIPFDAFSKLPKDLHPTTEQVQRFAANYLNNEKEYDWQGFLDAIKNYGGKDLSLLKHKYNQVGDGSASADAMVQQIVKCLLDDFQVVLTDADIAEMKGNIESTFTNLKIAESRGFASYSVTKTNSSYEYRVLFAFPNPNTPEEFHTLVSTIKLTVYIQHDENWWWGMESSTIEMFSAEVTAADLIVKKGFKNPVAGN